MKRFFLAFLFFAIDSEARHVIPLLPLILVPLGCVIDKVNLSAKAATSLLALQLLLSHFYVPINVAGIEESFERNDYYGVAQLYYMNFGPWMSLEFYIVWAVIAIIAARLVSFIIVRRKN